MFGLFEKVGGYSIRLPPGLSFYWMFITEIYKIYGYQLIIHLLPHIIFKYIVYYISDLLAPFFKFQNENIKVGIGKSERGYPNKIWWEIW